MGGFTVSGWSPAKDIRRDRQTVTGIGRSWTALAAICMWNVKTADTLNGTIAGGDNTRLRSVPAAFTEGFLGGATLPD